MQISFSVKGKDCITLLWLVGLCLLLSLSVGSMTEAEPKAATMFGVVTLVWALVAYPVFKWRNK